MNKLFKGILLFSICFFVVVILLSFGGMLGFGYGLGDLKYDFYLIILTIGLIIAYFLLKSIDFQNKIGIGIAGITVLFIFITLTMYLFTIGRGPEFKWDGYIFLSSAKLGIEKSEKEKSEVELKILDDSIAKNPSNYNAFFEKGLIFRHNGNWSASIIEYNKAIEINPEFFNAYTECAFNYSYIHDSINALQYYEKAHSLDSSNERIKDIIKNYKEYHNMK